MAKDLATDRVLEILRGAFLPLRCGAEALDYGTGVRFRVFGPDDQKLIRWEKIPATIAQDPRDLADIIAVTRDRLEAKKLKLDPWRFPKE